MARELVILPRFKRDYRKARKHAEFDAETLEYVFDCGQAEVSLRATGSRTFARGQSPGQSS